MSLLHLLVQFGTTESSIVGPRRAADTSGESADHDVALRGRSLLLRNAPPRAMVPVGIPAEGQKVCYRSVLDSALLFVPAWRTGGTGAIGSAEWQSYTSALAPSAGMRAIPIHYSKDKP